MGDFGRKRLAHRVLGSSAPRPSLTLNNCCDPNRSIYRSSSALTMLRCIGSAFPSKGLSHPNHVEACGHKICAHFPKDRRGTDLAACLKIASARAAVDALNTNTKPLQDTSDVQKLRHLRGFEHIAKEKAIGKLSNARQTVAMDIFSIVTSCAFVCACNFLCRRVRCLGPTEVCSVNFGCLSESNSATCQRLKHSLLK